MNNGTREWIILVNSVFACYACSKILYIITYQAPTMKKTNIDNFYKRNSLPTSNRSSRNYCIKGRNRCGLISRIGKMDMDVSEKAPDPGPVTTFNFTMELDQELAIEKCKILDPDMELLNWHIRLNHSPFGKSR